MKITEEIGMIDAYIIALVNRLGEGKWLDNNTLEFKKGRKILGKIELKDKQMVVKGEVVKNTLNDLIKEKENAEKRKITPTTAKKTIFKKACESPERYNGLIKNPDLFMKVSKEFEKIGIKEVLIETSLNRGNSIKKGITLAINCPPDDTIYESYPSGFHSRLKSILFDKMKHEYSNVEEFTAVSSHNWIKKLKAEKIKEIDFNGISIGRYFLERNLIHLYFNPFLLRKISIFDNTIPECIIETIDILKELKPKKVDVTKLQKKIFVTAFLEGSEKRKRGLEGDIKSCYGNISDYERQLRENITRLTHHQEELQYIEKNLELKGKGLYEEISSVKKLAFVTDLEIGTDFINIVFKPTTIRTNDFKTTDHGKNFGRRTFYLGPINIRIGPNQFKVTNKYYIAGGNAHPHVDASGTPCFGEGEGRNKIWELLALNKFTELSKLLWFWIKTYRNEGAHVKIWALYNDRLKNGYPIWDEKGNRIELNDKEKIKKGEQTTLKKSEIYEENIKRFKSMEVF